MLLIFILTHYYLIAKWHIISWCCCFGFQSLLRSPEVIRFLQQQQRLLTTQNQAQTPHNYWRCFNADTFNDIFTTAVFYTHVRTVSMWSTAILDGVETINTAFWKLGYLTRIWSIWKYCRRHQALLRSWNEIAANSNIYKQSSWITTLFGNI